MYDSFGRKISYLRLSVTDRCDFRCFYCLPRQHRDFEAPQSWLKPDEIQRLIRNFADLGVRHIRLTGGEPLVRKDLLEIAHQIARIPQLDDLSLSTNAARLAEKAHDLVRAGVKRLNISVDSLNVDNFKRITGGDLNSVLQGIDTAIEAGFDPIKINTVTMNGINDHETEDLVEFCLAKGLSLRFIETMPVGQGGQQACDHFLPLEKIKQRLEKSYRLVPTTMRGSGPARYYQIDGSRLIIGFITPQSQHFCESCNRVRLSVNGDLHLCLGQKDKLPLGEMLRSGVDDENLCRAILQSINRKPERHFFNEMPEQVIRPMSALGG